MHIQSSTSLSVGHIGSGRTRVMCQLPCILYRQRHREHLPQCSDIHIGKHLIGVSYPHVRGLTKWKADPASLASSGHSQTADHLVIHLHTRRLVSHLIHVQRPSCSLRHSVIVVSIVWIVVVPDVTQPDITCKYRSSGLVLHNRNAFDKEMLVTNAIVQGAVSILVFGQPLSLT